MCMYEEQRRRAVSLIIPQCGPTPVAADNGYAALTRVPARKCAIMIGGVLPTPPLPRSFAVGRFPCKQRIFYAIT
jgi:hypothetical protein